MRNLRFNPRAYTQCATLIVLGWTYAGCQRSNLPQSSSTIDTRTTDLTNEQAPQNLAVDAPTTGAQQIHVEQQLGLAESLRRKGRLQAALHLLQGMTRTSSPAMRLLASIHLTLGNTSQAQRVIEGMHPAPKDLLQNLATVEATIVERTKKPRAQLEYQRLLEMARSFRIKGDCGESLRLARQAESLQYPAGYALWQQSQAAACLRQNVDAAVLSSRSFAELNAESPVGWDAATGLVSNAFSGKALDDAYVVLSSDDRLHVHNGQTMRTWTVGTGRVGMDPEQIIQTDFSLYADGYSRDGQRIVMLRPDALIVADAVTGKVVWKDPVAGKGDGEVGPHNPKTELAEGEAFVLDPAPGLGDEAVILTSAGKFHRWDMATGKRLPTVTLPKSWNIRLVNQARTTRDADWVYVETWNDATQQTTGQYVQFPSGRPYFPKGKCPEPPETHCRPGFDAGHLLLAPKNATLHDRLFDLARQTPVAEYPRPTCALNTSSLWSSDLGKKAGLILLRDCGIQHEHDQEDGGVSLTTWVPVGIPADQIGNPNSTGKAFEGTHRRLRRVRYSPDEKLIAGWGEGGVVVWDASDGKKILELPTAQTNPSPSCVDELGNHVAWGLGNELLLVDLNDGNTKVVPSRPLSKVICDVRGLTGVTPQSFSGKPPQVTRWDWSGHEVEASTQVPPRTDEQPNRNLGADGTKIAGRYKLCREGRCSAVKGKLGANDAVLSLAFVLHGKLLVAMTDAGIELLTTDGSRLVGAISRAGNAGWYYFDAPAEHEATGMLRDRFQPFLRGTLPIDFLHGNADQNMFCSVGNQLYSWSLCSDWFENPGALKRRIAAVNTTMTSRPHSQDP